MEAHRLEVDVERAKVEEKIRQEVEQVQRGRSFGRTEDPGMQEGGYVPEEASILRTMKSGCTTYSMMMTTKQGA